MAEIKLETKLDPKTATKDTQLVTRTEFERLHRLMYGLVIAFFALVVLALITIAIDAIGALKSDTNSRDVLIQSVQQLNDKIKR